MRHEFRVLAHLEAGRKLRVLALKHANREREHRVLLQKHGVECELRIWCQQHYLQPLFADGELASSSTINILLGLQELLRTPCKLNLLSLGRSLAARLASATLLAMSQDIGFAGLLRDIVVSHVGPTGGCQTLKIS